MVTRTPPFLSVVLPVYNEEERLEQNVQKISDYLTRTYPDHEIIAVDDGSSDRSPTILQALATRIPRFRADQVQPERGKGHGGPDRDGGGPRGMDRDRGLGPGAPDRDAARLLHGPEGDRGQDRRGVEAAPPIGGHLPAPSEVPEPVLWAAARFGVLPTGRGHPGRFQAVPPRHVLEVRFPSIGEAVRLRPRAPRGPAPGGLPDRRGARDPAVQPARRGTDPDRHRAQHRPGDGRDLVPVIHHPLLRPDVRDPPQASQDASLFRVPN